MKMHSDYYRLIDDNEIEGRWFLNGVRDANGAKVSPRLFLTGQHLDVVAPVAIALRRPGRALDFTLGDFDMPVIRRALAGRVKEIAGDEVQVISAHIEGHGDDFAVLQATSALPCLDETAGHVVRSGASDSSMEAPKYKMVIGARVRRDVAEGRHFFRIDGWKVALIVSDKVRQILDDAEGVKFEPA